jgi:hypothetical protein
MHITRMALPMRTASDVYGASEELVRMSLNVTGALIRVARRAVG